MAAPKGHKQWGGRKKGTPNKSTLPVQQKADELGVNPFEILLFFAKGDWESLGYEAKTKSQYTASGVIYVDVITPDHRLKAASEACQYLHPKRKAIEVNETKNISEDPLPHVSNEELKQIQSKKKIPT